MFLMVVFRLQLFIFTCYFSYRCVIFTYFHALKSQCYIWCLSCTYITCRQTSFSHTFRKASRQASKQASRLTCINRCKDLSLNPINNNLIVLNWIGNARPCMLSDWLNKFNNNNNKIKPKNSKTKDINIDEPYMSEHNYNVWCTTLLSLGLALRKCGYHSFFCFYRKED